MSLLTFPDVNVWLALVGGDHIHHGRAAGWWRGVSSRIGFCRLTQTGLLRLLTTAAATNGQPLTMTAAWAVYDRIAEDDRVVFLPEPAELEREFRKQSNFATASPKLWSDAYLAAFAIQTGGTLITFDKAFQGRGVDFLILD
jgi:uncharacterized protein